MTAATALRLPAGLLGATTAPVTHTIDARWLMAYAAGLGETDPRFYDTLAPAGPVAHPLFPVGYEWAPLVTLREKTIGPELAPLSVHATHDLVIARPPRAGEALTTAARIIAVERRRAGTLVVARLTTVDADGAPVTATDYGSVYRGVEPAEEGRVADAQPAAAAAGEAVTWQERVTVDATAAHVYTECARIWNPIHTDVAVARAAGLPAIILHGTATLALAVSRVVRRDRDGDVRGIRLVQARFTGFVRLPSTFTVRGHAGPAGAAAFDAVADDGTLVLAGGSVSP